MSPEGLATALSLRDDPTDPEVSRVINNAIRALNAIAWDRFRARHEAASQAKRNARMRAAFVARHKRGPHP